jgi:CRISPR-associated protein Cmr3
MSFWHIEPRDPLAVRDGRPNNGRSEPLTLSFPFPSTIAGMVRTHLGSDERGVFELHDDLDSLRRAAIRGPLLVRLRDGRIYVPPPRDCVVLEKQPKGRAIQALLPMSPPPGAVLDEELTPQVVGFGTSETPTRKPARSAPAWWSWPMLEEWLAMPSARDSDAAEAFLREGLPRLPLEPRMHVKIGERFTSEEGMLFQSSGLRFQITPKGDRFAIGFSVDTAGLGGGARTLREGVSPCGGERRLVYWQHAPGIELPRLPTAVRDALRKQEPRARVRVSLLTPAIFEEGFRPGKGEGQLLQERHGVKVSLAAALVPRPETISGWDLEARGPKKSRRVVSAGSVYWIDLDGAPLDRLRWAEEVMMTNVSDGEQDRRDGFGLAVVGVGS